MYESHLRIYVDFLDVLDDITPEQAEYAHIYNFFNFQANEYERSKGTLEIYKNHIKQFYGFLERYDEHADPKINSSKIELINLNEISNKTHTFRRTAISRDEVELMYNNTTATQYSARDELLLRVLYETGGRNDDVAGLERENIRNKEDGVWIYYLDSKNGNDYKVPIREDLAIRIKLFCNGDRPAIPGASGHDYVFPSYKGGRLSVSAVCRIVRKIAVEAGIQEEIAKIPTTPAQPDQFTSVKTIHRVTPHTFRHAIVTHLSNDNIPRKLQKFLTGHSSDVIEDYDHSDDATAFNMLRDSIN